MPYLQLDRVPKAGRDNGTVSVAGVTLCGAAQSTVRLSAGPRDAVPLGRFQVGSVDNSNFGSIISRAGLSLESTIIHDPAQSVFESVSQRYILAFRLYIIFRRPEIKPNMALPKRIIKETERLMAEPVPGINAVPHEDNLRYFDVSIHGPSQSPYEGGIFRLELFLPDDYPMTPPKIRFLTKIYHPNIDRLGRICLDVLKNNWSPALQIRTILLSIQALLGAPNPDDPLANDVAQRWKDDEPAAIQTAKEWTRTHAMA
ncbi:Uncharacterized protein PECH_002696 [Penicillium ucsense]|uniref:E2 ubiquitin-conjugating enzyme n=2 Tax=Penicillium TaxID=5073 RepID=A0A8J8W7J5_9EURO|nr:Uncharacterized protein PECM_003587 [Penicillium ucsense]KAF7737863.1 Uncharacterized protein PECH_002696 [Penicillium ucsense]